MGDFRNLKAWQHARTLVVLTKSAIAQLPETERYALADQWRRATYSVALNIAEGASRRGVKDFRRHLDIARGSLHEVEAILELVLAQGYVRPESSPPYRPRETSVRERYMVSFEHCRTDRSNPVVSPYGLRLAAYALRLFPAAGLLLCQAVQCPEPPH